MSVSINILVADDHAIYRKGIAVLLRGQSIIKIIGEAGDGKEVISKVAQLQPDVVLMDIKMPHMDGIEAAHYLTQHYPRIGVIALSMYDEDSLVIDMLDAGAKGYLLKNTTKKELLVAIETIHKGGTYYSDETTQRLTRLIANSKAAQRNGAIELTPSEIEIIRLMCQEYTSKQISAELGYTTRTIESYRKRIQEKLDAKNMIGIVVYAIKHGIYRP